MTKTNFTVDQFVEEFGSSFQVISTTDDFFNCCRTSKIHEFLDGKKNRKVLSIHQDLGFLPKKIGHFLTKEDAVSDFFENFIKEGNLHLNRISYLYPENEITVLRERLNNLTFKEFQSLIDVSVVTFLKKKTFFIPSDLLEICRQKEGVIYSTLLGKMNYQLNSFHLEAPFNLVLKFNVFSPSSAVLNFSLNYSLDGKSKPKFSDPRFFLSYDDFKSNVEQQIVSLEEDIVKLKSIL